MLWEREKKENEKRMKMKKEAGKEKLRLDTKDLLKKPFSTGQLDRY